MIVLKSKREIEKMRTSNLIVVEILEKLKELCLPGITTLEIDKLAEELAKKKGAKPVFKGYRGFPNSTCISINEEIVHGIPSPKRYLKEGDIVSIDFGVIYEGFVGDAALTVPVGKISDKAERLLKVTEESLYKGIEQMKAGNRLYDVSAAIQNYVEQHGYNVIRDFVGHGVGRYMHEEPQVPNYVPHDGGIRLKVGMVLALEPMVSEGTWQVEVLKDGWTAVTKDRSLSAHFEHSVAITEEGPYILSKR